MIGERTMSWGSAILLLASSLTATAAQTTSLDVPTGLPASCTPLATLLSEYPPPADGEVVDSALNDGLRTFYSELYSSYQETATKKPAMSLNRTSLCDFIISTQVPSATPSATSALSSYISAAGLWLEDHGLAEAESLLEGDCDGALLPGDETAIGNLDFVVAFGPCYELLGWDQRTPSSSGATTTDASSQSTTTSSQPRSTLVTPSPTGQSSESDASPPSAGSRKIVDVFWVLAMTVCVISLLL